MNQPPTLLERWHRLLAATKAPRPLTLNYQVNDICNSKCVMCHIWKNRERIEMSPVEWLEMLRRPFFQKVRHIGITGGEPTLRSDLAEYYLGLPEALPKLEGASFITNGFSRKIAVKTYSAVHEKYAEFGKSFQGMVSLDGVGEMHDRVRGKAGSFDKATRTFFDLRDNGVPVIVSCTIVKENVYGVYDLLDWAKENDIYIRFRVGEFINRLYNTHLKEQIRAFTDDEIKHLVSFFAHLVDRYEPQEIIKKTYRSNQSILTGGVRLITCPYQSVEALNLDSQGRFAHCAPQGKPHALGKYPRYSLVSEQAERDAILRDKCPNCIHDYHHDWTQDQRTYLETRDQLEETYYHATDSADRTFAEPARTVPWQDLKHIVLIGWYGTETLGDVAIIKGVIEKYLALNPKLRFTVLSLFPTYTRLTARDLTAEIGCQLDVLDHHDAAVPQLVQDACAVAIAGGPMMDLRETRHLASLLIQARRAGNYAIMEGCGIGPLSNTEYIDNVAKMLGHADEIRVRDERSREIAGALNFPGKINVEPDPAAPAIQKYGIQANPQPGQPVALYLREITEQYIKNLSVQETTDALLMFLQKLADWKPDQHFEFNAMSYYAMGHDDRLFGRELLKQLPADRFSVNLTPLTMKQQLERMASAPFVVCMRYHSVVFAHQCGARFFPIDYTYGGKIGGYLKDIGKPGLGVTVEDLPNVSAASFDQTLEQSQA